MLIIIDGKPQPKQRARTANGHHYTPKETVEYENKVKWEYKRQKGKYYTGAVNLKIFVSIARPKYHYNAKGEVKLQYKFADATKKPDIDNITKSIFDALNGVAYKDDSQIVSCAIEKSYGSYYRVILNIEGIRGGRK